MILHGSDRPDLLIAETLPDILEATILRHPDAVAIHWQDQSITYETLGRRADLAAHHLIEAGVRPGDIVGLCLPRGDELLLMQAAIAKAGAAWLPFESDTPPERMQACLQDAGAQYIVAGGEVQLDGIATCTPWQLSQPAAGSAPLRRRAGCCPSIRPTSSTPPVPLASPRACPSPRPASATSCAARTKCWACATATRSTRAFRWPSTCRSRKSGSATWSAPRSGSRPRC